jgi:hypothetical protein
LLLLDADLYFVTTDAGLLGSIAVTANIPDAAPHTPSLTLRHCISRCRGAPSGCRRLGLSRWSFMRRQRVLLGGTTL